MIGRTGAQFQGTVRILIIEWLTVQAIEVINCQISVIEKYDMGCVLTCNTLMHESPRTFRSDHLAEISRGQSDRDS